MAYQTAISAMRVAIAQARAGGSNIAIDDTTTGTDSVWSSDKTNTELTAKADAADLTSLETTVSTLSTSGGAAINDAATSTVSTWSSQQINTTIDTKADVSTVTALETQVNALASSDGLNGGSFTGYIAEAHNVLTGTTVAINCTTSNSFSLTLSGNTTISFTNVPSGSYSMYLQIQQNSSGSGYVVNWPGSVKFTNGIAPMLSSAANALDVFVLKTIDQGASWILSEYAKNVG